MRPRLRPRQSPAPLPTPPSRVGLLLHRLQEELLNRWKDELAESGGILGAELRRYRAGYEEDFKRTWQVSTPGELVQSVRGADVVFCGDHHVLVPAQRLLLRLLRRVVPGDRPATLALEMLHSRDQPLVDSFLAGSVDAGLLRDALSHDTRWPFDWEAYFPLLDFARRNRLPVVAINSEPGTPRASRLARRDAHAALRIVDRLASDPGARIFVLAGDWHMAEGHLPALVAELARRRRIGMRRLIVHQNHDGTYRRLMKLLGYVPAVVRGGNEMYCVLNSTPLVKARAQLAWVGRRLNDADDTPDSAAAFLDIARALVRHLGLDPRPLDRITPWEMDHDPELVSAGRLLGWSRSYRMRQARRLDRGEVLHLRRRGLLLLRHPPLNQLTEAAAGALGATLGPVNSAPPRERYAARAVHAGALCFATRLINPRRKCDLFADILDAPSGPLVAEAAATWAELLLRGRGAPAARAAFWRLPPRRLSAAARRVGAAWGYALYDRYVAGELNGDFVRRLFTRDRPGDCPARLLEEAMGEVRGGLRYQSKRQLL